MGPDFMGTRSLERAESWCFCYIRPDQLSGVSERFAEPFDGKTVVVTHHAPSERSVAPKYAGQILNHAYFSHMDDMIEAAKPAIWVHGHVHSSFSYKIGETRVVCNPRGYPLREGPENPEFDPQMAVEV